MRSSRVQNIDFVVTVDREFVRPVRVIETSNQGPNSSGSRPPVLRLRHTRFFFPSWFFETYGRKTGECRTRRTTEKCVLFLRFENLFLGGLLAFRYSVVLRRIKHFFQFWTFPRFFRWEGQELRNRMCCHNLDLETTTQTFMLRVRPSPIRVSSSVEHVSSWSCDESKKTTFSSHISGCGIQQ